MRTPPFTDGFDSVPLIDVHALVTPTSSLGARRAVAAELGAACRESGFFYVVGHGVEAALQARLEEASRRFFALPLDDKLAIRMARGGRAWRGYFPVGGELTSGRPDRKEGLYFGAELGPDHPLVRAGTPLHGPNLFPPSRRSCATPSSSTWRRSPASAMPSWPVSRSALASRRTTSPRAT